MRFAQSENAHNVLLALRHYVEQYGIPQEIYTDRANMYHPQSKGGKRTDVGHALTRLGVRMIPAHSPQAKGRVERSNRTPQDRLVKALRRHNISSIIDANRFLEDVYLKEHSNQFASLHGLRDIHHPSEGLDFNNIFCFETSRRVYNDFTISVNASFVQLERSPRTLSRSFTSSRPLGGCTPVARRFFAYLLQQRQTFFFHLETKT